MAEPTCIHPDGKDGGVCGKPEHWDTEYDCHDAVCPYCDTDICVRHHHYRPGVECEECGGEGKAVMSGSFEWYGLRMHFSNTEPCPVCKGSRYVDA